MTEPRTPREGPPGPSRPRKPPERRRTRLRAALRAHRSVRLRIPFPLWTLLGAFGGALLLAGLMGAGTGTDPGLPGAVLFPVSAVLLLGWIGTSPRTGGGVLETPVRLPRLSGTVPPPANPRLRVLRRVSLRLRQPAPRPSVRPMRLSRGLWLGAGTFGGVFLGITLFGIGTYHHEFVQPWIYVPGAVLVLLWWFTAPRRSWVRREAHATVLRDRARRRGANPPVDDETGAERLRLRRLARSLEARRGPRWMRTPMFRRYQLRNE